MCILPCTKKEKRKVTSLFSCTPCVSELYLLRRDVWGFDRTTQIKPIADPSIISHPVVTISLITSFIPPILLILHILSVPSNLSLLPSSKTDLQPQLLPMAISSISLSCFSPVSRPSSTARELFQKCQPPKNTSSFTLVLLFTQAQSYYWVWVLSYCTGFS